MIFDTLIQIVQQHEKRPMYLKQKFTSLYVKEKQQEECLAAESGN